MTKGVVVKIDRSNEDAPDAYRLDDQVGYILRLASQRHSAIFQQHAVHGLTPTQFSVMIRLAECPNCSQNRLGRLTGMDVATIKGVVDRLRLKGFLILTPDPDDKRRTLISLSKKGADAIDQLRAMGHRVTQETLAPLTAAERKTFLRLLSKLV